MSLTDSELRQTAADREYLTACEQHGIKPDGPRYNGWHGDGPDGALDARILHEFSSLDAPQEADHFFDDPDDQEEDSISDHSRDAFTRLLSLITSTNSDPEKFVRVAGIKILCLSWLLQREPHAGKSLASMAEKLKVSRACLSAIVRKLEDATGLHARGQKSATACEAYRDARNRSLASQKEQDAQA